MPKALDVYPKGVHVTVDFPLMELVAIRLMLDSANIEFNSEENPEMVEASKLLNESIYPFLETLCDDQMPDEVKYELREMIERSKK